MHLIASRWHQDEYGSWQQVEYVGGSVAQALKAVKGNNRPYLAQEWTIDHWRGGEIRASVLVNERSAKELEAALWAGDFYDREFGL